MREARQNTQEWIELPININYSRYELELMGFEFGKEIDGYPYENHFQKTKLPKGWKLISITNNSKWDRQDNIVDNKGRIRGKCTNYVHQGDGYLTRDRMCAEMRLYCRYIIEQDVVLPRKNENDALQLLTCLRENKKDGKILLMAGIRTLGDNNCRDSLEAHTEKCHAMADKFYPNWNKPWAYWDDKSMENSQINYKEAWNELLDEVISARNVKNPGYEKMDESIKLDVVYQYERLYSLMQSLKNKHTTSKKLTTDTIKRPVDKSSQK